MQVAQEDDWSVRRDAVGSTDPGLLRMVGVSTDFKLRVDLPGGSVLVGREGFQEAAAELVQGLVGALLADAVDDEEGGAFGRGVLIGRRWRGDLRHVSSSTSSWFFFAVA